MISCDECTNTTLIKGTDTDILVLGKEVGIFFKLRNIKIFETVTSQYIHRKMFSGRKYD